MRQVQACFSAPMPTAAVSLPMLNQQKICIVRVLSRRRLASGMGVPWGEPNGTCMYLRNVHTHFICGIYDVTSLDAHRSIVCARPYCNVCPSPPFSARSMAFRYMYDLSWRLP